MTKSISGAGNDHVENALKAGLSSKAAAVYVALLSHGVPMIPKVIVQETGIHRQYVYDGLEELLERKLARKVGTGRRIKYEPSSPDLLYQDAERKRLEIQEGARRLMELYEHSPAGFVEVIRGARATVESELALLREAEKGSFLDIVGGAGMNWVRLFEGRIDEWEAIRKERCVKLRYIGTEEDVRHNREVSVIENESRAIPGIGNIVNVAIRPDSVTFNIYEPEIVTVRVRNKEAVASQRALFEVLWGVAQ